MGTSLFQCIAVPLMPKGVEHKVTSGRFCAALMECSVDCKDRSGFAFLCLQFCGNVSENEASA
jgi:hypothetical protein